MSRAAVLACLSSRKVEQWQVILFGVALALLAYGGLGDLLPDSSSGLGNLGSSYRFLATFALWLINLCLLWRPSKIQAQVLAPSEKVRL